jgi:dihydrofolate reductase
MIRAIVAIDEKRGMANDQGIPWRSKVPQEIAYFRDNTAQGDILMGYGTYLEFKKPFHDHLNYVATNRDEELKPGFEKVTDAREFLKNYKGDLVWNIGGAGLLTQTLDLSDELYITQIQGDFKCTKFLPEFKDKYKMSNESPPITENGITYTFQVWQRK